MFALYKTPLFIIVTILVGFFLIRPEYANIQDVQARTEDYMEANKQVQEYTRTLRQRQSSIASIPAEDLTKLNRIVAADGIDAPQVLEDLTSLADRLGLNVDSANSVGELSVREEGGTSPTRVTEGDFYTLDVSLAISGSYDAMKQFIDAVERSLTPYEVVSLQFDVRAGGTNDLSFSIQIRTWSLIPKEEF